MFRLKLSLCISTTLTTRYFLMLCNISPRSREHLYTFFGFWKHINLINSAFPPHIKVHGQNPPVSMKRQCIYLDLDLTLLIIPWSIGWRILMVFADRNFNLIALSPSMCKYVVPSSNTSSSFLFSVAPCPIDSPIGKLCHQPL